MGNGWYSQKLPYKDWYEFNCAQRAHQNYFEHLPSIVSIILIGGLYVPAITLAYAILCILVRTGYAISYSTRGAGARVPFIAVDLLSRVSLLLWLTYTVTVDFSKKGDSRVIV